MQSLVVQILLDFLVPSFHSDAVHLYRLWLLRSLRRNHVIIFYLISSSLIALGRKHICLAWNCCKICCRHRLSSIDHTSLYLRCNLASALLPKFGVCDIGIVKSFVPRLQTRELITSTRLSHRTGFALLIRGMWSQHI